MTRQSLSRSVAVCFLAVAMCAGASADTVFFDDFSDGSVTNNVPLDRDGNPVTWFPGGNADLAVDAGDLVVGGGSAGPRATASGTILGNTSLRTQLRMIHGYGTGVSVRHTPDASGRDGVFGLILGDGRALVGFAGTGEVIDEVGTGLIVSHEDVVMQLDAIGNTVSLWLWRPSESMPVNPLLTFMNDSVVSGSISVSSLSETFPSGGLSAAVFRYVHVADMHIPEPSTVALLLFGTCAALTFLRNRRNCWTDDFLNGRLMT